MEKNDFAMEKKDQKRQTRQKETKRRKKNMILRWKISLKKKKKDQRDKNKK